MKMPPHYILAVENFATRWWAAIEREVTLGKTVSDVAGQTGMAIGEELQGNARPSVNMAWIAANVLHDRAPSDATEELLRWFRGTGFAPDGITATFGDFAAMLRKRELARVDGLTGN